MFINEPTNQEKRWIAYWVFMNGCIRLSLQNKCVNCLNLDKSGI